MDIHPVVDELSESDRKIDSLVRDVLDPFEKNSAWERISTVSYEEQVDFINHAVEAAKVLDEGGREAEVKIIKNLKDTEASSSVLFHHPDTGIRIEFSSIPDYREDLLLNGTLDRQLTIGSEVSFDSQKQLLTQLREDYYNVSREHETEYLSPLPSEGYEDHLDLIIIGKLEVPVQFDSVEYENSLSAISKIVNNFEEIYGAHLGL